MKMNTKTRSSKTATVAPEWSATTAIERATMTATEMAKKARSALSEHPVAAVVGAFATGAAIAKLAGRG
jgi:IMP cyclohydrolase